MNEFDEGESHAPPIWAIFGDLMSGLVGVFVLLLIWALGFQLELAQSLKVIKDLNYSCFFISLLRCMNGLLQMTKTH